LWSSIPTPTVGSAGRGPGIQETDYFDLANGAAATSIGTLGSAGTSGITTGISANVTPTVVAATSQVIMYFGPTTAINLQICGVQVTYDLP
jgi:hypothetical protein